MRIQWSQRIEKINPRQSSRKAKKSRQKTPALRRVFFGVSLQHGSNSFYPKFLNETSRFAPPPCRETARLAEKLPLQFLICARLQKILLKGKGNFSARLCSERTGGGRSLFRTELRSGAGLPARARRPRNYLAEFIPHRTCSGAGLEVRGKNSP
jgi:hypothetical protein